MYSLPDFSLTQDPCSAMVETSKRSMNLSTAMRQWSPSGGKSSDTHLIDIQSEVECLGPVSWLFMVESRKPGRKK